MKFAKSLQCKMLSPFVAPSVPGLNQIAIALSIVLVYCLTSSYRIDVVVLLVAYPLK